LTLSDTPNQPAGWYYAQGDPPGTQRYWNGEQWEGGPQSVPGFGQEVPAGPVPTDVGKRIGGRLIDVLLWIVVSAVIQLVVIGSGGLTASTISDVSYGRAVVAGLITTVVVSGYEVLMLANRGATLGKMAVNTRVIRSDGSAVDVTDAVKRISPYLVLNVLGSVTGTALGALFSFALFVIGLVSFVFLFTDQRRQTVWDKIADTVVVDA
jgi:uncharacterized RDD family membrane protein YckC